MRKINNWTDYNKLVKEETYNVAKIEDTYIYQLETEFVMNKDDFKFFNVTAEDLELSPEEQEKFDLYIRGLWKRQKGDLDGR